jgi:hypothetical protein
MKKNFNIFTFISLIYLTSCGMQLEDIENEKNPNKNPFDSTTIFGVISSEAAASIEAGILNLSSTTNTSSLSAQSYAPSNIEHQWIFNFTDGFGTKTTCTTNFNKVGTTVTNYLLTSSSDCSYYLISGTAEAPTVNPNLSFLQGAFEIEYCIKTKIPELNLTSTPSCNYITGIFSEPENICKGKMTIDNIKVFNHVIIPNIAYDYRPNSLQYPTESFAVICDEQDLKDVADYMKTLSSPMNVNLILGKHLDMAKFYSIPGNDQFSLDNVAFAAVFDGNNLKIKNFSYSANSSVNKPIGLFSQFDQAQVRNLELLNHSILDGSQSLIDNYVGGLVGTAIHSTIEDVKVSSEIYCNGSIRTWACGGVVGSIEGNSLIQRVSTNTTIQGQNTINAGGLAGRVSTSTVDVTNIRNSTSQGNIIALGGIAHNGAGGLIGLLKRNAHVEDCSSTGNVETLASEGHAGGLVASVANNATIKRSYSTANVIKNTFSLNSGTGGLVGQLVGTITDSYATGNVSGISNIGGLVGYGWLGSVARVHATGNVSGTGINVGGIVGRRTSTVFSNCYFNTDTTGISSSSYCTGLNSVNMIVQSNFIGFDFINTWLMGTGSPDLI